MVDDTKAGSAAEFMSGVRESIRQDFDQEYDERMFAAREQIRQAQDYADGLRICANTEREQLTARMAEYRRGKWYHVGAVVTSACSGFVMGYLTQKNLDLRVRGVPAMAIAGLPGIVGGGMLDEGVATRAALSVGGTMFSVGTITYALCNPPPPEEPKS